METIKITVFGKVQGVFFRKHTKEVADRLSITGTVENKPDGTVEIFATGTTDALEQFKSWCKQGEPPAQVDRIEIHQSDRVSETDRFEVIG